MLNEQVRNIMTKDPLIVSPEESLDHVSDLMAEQKVQQVPVVKDGQFMGLITTYDLWQGLRRGQSKIEDIMTKKVIKITPIDKVGTAAELFMDKRFKALPVVNLKNEFKGIVTAFDVLRHVMQREYQADKTLYPEVLSNK
jgi:CBS domain-containing protein